MLCCSSGHHSSARGKRRLAREIGDVATVRFERLMIALLLRRLARPALAAADRGNAGQGVPSRPALAPRHSSRRPRQRRSGRPHAPRTRRLPARPGGAGRRRHPGTRRPPRRRRFPLARPPRPRLRPGRGWRVLARRRAPLTAPAAALRAGALVEPLCARRHARQAAATESRSALSSGSKTSITARPIVGSLRVAASKMRSLTQKSQRKRRACWNSGAAASTRFSLRPLR